MVESKDNDEQARQLTQLNAEYSSSDAELDTFLLNLGKELNSAIASKANLQQYETTIQYRAAMLATMCLARKIISKMGTSKVLPKMHDMFLKQRKNAKTEKELDDWTRCKHEILEEVDPSTFANIQLRSTLERVLDLIAQLQKTIDHPPLEWSYPPEHPLTVEALRKFLIIDMSEARVLANHTDITAAYIHQTDAAINRLKQSCGKFKDAQGNLPTNINSLITILEEQRYFNFPRPLSAPSGDISAPSGGQSPC